MKGEMSEEIKRKLEELRGRMGTGGKAWKG